MSIYSNGSAFQLPLPGHAPALTGTVIQTLRHPSGAGRTHTTCTAQGETAGLLRVTPRGHWYRVEDAACRGCGTALVGPAAGMARTDAVLDRGGRCAHPVTAQDIATALLGRTAVAA